MFEPYQNELVIQTSQIPGMVTFYNFEEAKATLQNNMAFYAGVVYDSVSEAEEDKKTLSKIQRLLKDKKKEIEVSYSQPYEVVKKQLDELIEMVSEPLKIADKYIKANEKREKQERIYLYAENLAKTYLGQHAEQIINSPVFFKDKWLNKTCKDTQWKHDINELVNKALSDLNIISSYDYETSKILAARYYETLSLEGMDKFIEHSSILKNERESATAISQSCGSINTQEKTDEQIMYGLIKLYGTSAQLNYIVRQMKNMGIKFKILDKGQLGQIDI